MNQCTILATLLAARRVTPRLLAVLAAAWLTLFAFASVTVPLKYPYESPGVELMDSGVVAGLVAPISVLGRTLDEPCLQLLAAASRRTWRERLGWAALVLALTVAVTALMTPILPRVVSGQLLVADAALLSGVSLATGGFIGGDLAWLGPLTLVGIASAPGLVPAQWNALYAASNTQLAWILAVLSAILGAATYACRGSAGPQWRQRLTQDLAGVNAE